MFTIKDVQSQSEVYCMPTLQIILDSASNSFFANSTARGKVIVNTKKPLKARNFIVTILGYAKTNWIREVKINKARAEYKSLQFFIEKQIILWQASEEITKIPVGCHTFPFEFYIPYDAAPNLITDRGNICYTVEAEIYTPWTSKNKKATLEFSVCPFVDLNWLGETYLLSAMNITEDLNPVKALRVSLKISKIGYVCGESIPLQIGIINNSTSNVTSIEPGFESFYTLTGECVNPPPMAARIDTKSRSKKFHLPKLKILIGRNNEIEFVQNVEVPPLPPSYDGCGFIKIQHRVYIKVHTDALLFNSRSQSVGIVIGTIPLNADLFERRHSPSNYKISHQSEDIDEVHTYYTPPPPPTNDIPADFDFSQIEFRELPIEERLKNDIKVDTGFQPKYPFFINFNKSSDKKTPTDLISSLLGLNKLSVGLD